MQDGTAGMGMGKMLPNQHLQAQSSTGFSKFGIS